MDSDENVDYRELQESLGLFQRGVVSIAFLNLLYILKDSALLLEYIEEHLSYDEQLQYHTIGVIKTSIESNVNKVFERKNEVYTLIMKYRKSIFSESKVASTLTEMWKKYENPIQDVLDSGIPYIRNKLDKLDTGISTKIITEQTSVLIKNIITYLCKLKMSELFLGVDIFWKGEIMPPLRDHDNYPDQGMTVELRGSYQKIKGKIEEFADQKKKEKNHPNSILDSKGFLEFRDLFMFKVRATDYMDIVAVDIVNYIKLTGKAIRLIRVLFGPESLGPVS